MAPQPPTEPGLAVTPVQFGQEWTDPNGDTEIAAHTGVLLELKQDGRTVAALFQTPRAALALGQMLATAASDAINSEITDDGRPLPFLERLQRLGAKEVN